MYNKLIGYGYGDACKFLTNYYELNWEFIVDQDTGKWNKQEKIFPKEYLEQLFLDDYKIIVFPFSNIEIIKYLNHIGFRNEQIILFENLLKDNKDLNYAYTDLTSNKQTTYDKQKETSQFFREIRKNQVPEILDKEAFFKSFYNKKFYYKEIYLNEVLAGEINNLLSFISYPSKLPNLFYQPIQCTYTIYGNGPIVIPFFATFRNDHTIRINKILNLLGEKNVTLITTKDYVNKFNLDFKREANFVFNPSKTIHSEPFFNYTSTNFGNLTFYEKKWLKYTASYHIQLIDFFNDTLNLINFKILLSLFPYYLQENIIYQFAKQNNAITVIHQHGNFTLNNSEEIHWLLIKYNLNTDYYIVWNEASKKELIKLHQKNPNSIKVLGNLINYNKVYKKKCLKKFLLILPGKIIDYQKIIEDIIYLSIKIASLLNIIFDIRYHPLNIVNNSDILNNEKFFGQILDNNSSDFNDYAFIIGRDSSLLNELRDCKHLVFNIGDNDVKYSKKIINRIQQEKKSYYENINEILENQVSGEEILNKYKIFLEDLLNDRNGIDGGSK